MFKRKHCKNCDKKINENYDFCPYCGDSLSNNKKNKDWGMLGKNDVEDFNNIQMPMGLNTLFNTLMKNLDKQFSDIEKNTRRDIDPNIKRNGISINISTSGNKPPKIKIKEFGNPNQKKEPTYKEIKGKPMKNIPYEKMKKISKLTKKEPVTRMKRVSDSLLYEMEIPGVQSIDNIGITKLENSIEIKAISNKIVYSKILPVNLPIINYLFNKEKLILELKS